MSEGREKGHAPKPALKISEQVEAGARHAASALGGGVTAALTYLGAEAVFKTMGFMEQAQEAGLFSGASGSAVLGVVGFGASAYSAVKTAQWSWKMHSVAEQIESGAPAPKRKH